MIPDILLSILFVSIAVILWFITPLLLYYSIKDIIRYLKDNNL